jgi:hypothetical protein
MLSAYVNYRLSNCVCTCVCVASVISVVSLHRTAFTIAYPSVYVQSVPNFAIRGLNNEIFDTFEVDVSLKWEVSRL